VINELNKGSILIISGPSGCGKSSLLKELYKSIDNYYFSVSTTTREPRNGEIEAKDYFFVSQDDFEHGIKQGNFLEYAKVHDNYYGTSLKEVKKALNQSKLVIFDIDVQGHDLVREKLDYAVTSIFVTTPGINELEKRLKLRQTDSLNAIQNRLENAKKEINFIDKYDYLIVNDNLENSAKQLINIAFASRYKTSLFNKDMIVSKWNT